MTTTTKTLVNRSSAALKIIDTDVRKLAEFMVSRMLRLQLDEWLLVAANSTKITNPPSNAQISHLRSIVIKEIRETKPDTTTICQCIKGIQARGSARRQFERSSVKGETLLSWLKRLLVFERPGQWTMDDNQWKALLHMSGVEVGARIGDVMANKR